MLLLLTWIRQIELQWPKFIAHISQRSTTLQKCSVCSIGPQFPLNLTKCRSWTFTNHKRSGRNQRLAMSISSSVYSHWLLLHESPPLLLPLFAGPLASFTSLPPFSFSATMLSSTTHQCSAAPLHQLRRHLPDIPSHRTRQHSLHASQAHSAFLFTQTKIKSIAIHQ
jgi:hypothetical protein